MTDQTCISEDILFDIALKIQGKNELSLSTFEEIIESDNDLAELLLQSSSDFDNQILDYLNNTDSLEQAQLRESIVSTIEDKLGHEILYPRLIPEQEELCKGSKVRIRRGSIHYGKPYGIGTLTKDFGEMRYRSGLWTEVEFEGGGYYYQPKDLEFAVKRELTEEENTKNRELLEQVRETPFSEFRTNILTQLYEISGSSRERAMRKIKGFRAGDEIVVDKKASNNFDLSLEGTVGKIIRRVSSTGFKADFTRHTGDTSKFVGEFYIYTDNILGLTDPEVENERLRECFETLFDETANNLIKKRMDDSLRKKRANKLVDILLSSGVIMRRGESLYVDINQIIKHVAPRLAAAYSNPKLYSSPDQFSPPSERKPHVLRFELTTGCNKKRKCTYCDGYKGVPFTERSYKEFMAHYKEVLRAIGDHKGNIERIFIGGGNALDAKQDTLRRVVERIEYRFNPRRIAIYGTTDAIIEKGVSRLSTLRRNGLSLIYWGIESGADSLLEYVNKGTTRERMLDAAKIANVSGMELSVMVMPGLGGIDHYDAHVNETASLLNEIGAEYVTFMGVNPAPDSAYVRKMQREETNRPLTDLEMVRQVRDMLQLMDVRATHYQKYKIGMFGCGIDQVGRNPIAFNVDFHESGKKEAMRICNEYFCQSSGTNQKSQ